MSEFITSGAASTGELIALMSERRWRTVEIVLAVDRTMTVMEDLQLAVEDFGRSVKEFDLACRKIRLPREPQPKPEPLRVAILNRMAGARHFSSLNHSVMRRARSGLPARHRYYQGDF